MHGALLLLIYFFWSYPIIHGLFAGNYLENSEDPLIRYPKGLYSTGKICFQSPFFFFFFVCLMLYRFVLLFRDGVSEGQFSQVLLYEMDAIRKV